MNSNNNCTNNNTNNDINKIIEAEMTYLVKDKIRHQRIMGPDMDLEKAKRIGKSVKKTVQVHNGRSKSDLTIDDAAFELVNCPTSLSTEEFYQIQDGNAELKNRYFKEVENMVKAKLGCDKVILWGNVVRNEKKKSPGGVQKYFSGMPHVDSMDTRAEEQIMEHLEKENDTTKYKRAVYVNFWRNISDKPIQQNHLAMVDERSLIKPDDILDQDIVFPPEVKHEGKQLDSATIGALSSRHADNHKWYYFPKMVKDEGILFKNFDSDFTQNSRHCFHSAIFDKNMPDDTPPRESIEVRMFCYFKEAEIDTMPTKENTYSNQIMTRNEREYTVTDALSTSTMVKAVLGRISPLTMVVSSIALACMNN